MCVGLQVLKRREKREGKGREGWREGRRERGKEGEKEGWRDGGRERGREGESYLVGWFESGSGRQLGHWSVVSW